MIDVAIVGATGYTALELARMILNHPQARLTLATSRQEDRPRLDTVHPSLARRTTLSCEPYDPDRVAELAQVAFLGLPHTASLEAVPDLRRRGVRVIDLSADYRLKCAETYHDWYGHVHTDPAGLAEAVYGLPELFRERIPTANLIANPGCYTSTAILALAPLVAEDKIDRRSIIIDAKSGVSGAGRTPKLTTHFPECNESLAAYNVGRHRHTPEIDQILSEVGCSRRNEPVEVIFTPHLVPMDRGILATIYAQPLASESEADLMDLYRSFYRHCPCVRVTSGLPATKDSAHTNWFDVTVRIVRGRIVVLAALDNLIKGAAGVAIQNFNLMHHLPETTGIPL
ncbi:N-acetyl-gamma-glutamyl-phosphate reductase [Isosphaera pallida ATCC 43644]|jgi:N-acetyl-gamma-glutamyl-phosphate reductase|uniref:N-acetyl-gamma-glutamyl-phosphate reductase n=1 Tax=Isosphaera pallida (strain ATCC 43644 / DSM 9630 / IS1B) TaxID=575540 RepID=E8R0G0_ISOPI|nr:N-acetyl-gamma-glutamyl-phosphate reductase [Isosphaera pallida]ADV63292.1 N-acetyl-gamma-glutamyl-phosphate reductase [Isosphaera pallida ATCC 43644]